MSQGKCQQYAMARRPIQFYCTADLKTYNSINLYCKLNTGTPIVTLVEIFEVFMTIVPTGVTMTITWNFVPPRPSIAIEATFSFYGL